jgi:hypothetical protein
MEPCAGQTICFQVGDNPGAQRIEVILADKFEQTGICLADD